MAYNHHCLFESIAVHVFCLPLVIRCPQDLSPQLHFRSMLKEVSHLSVSDHSLSYFFFKKGTNGIRHFFFGSCHICFNQTVFMDDKVWLFTISINTFYSIKSKFDSLLLYYRSVESAPSILSFIRAIRQPFAHRCALYIDPDILPFP